MCRRKVMIGVTTLLPSVHPWHQWTPVVTAGPGPYQGNTSASVGHIQQQYQFQSRPGCWHPKSVGYKTDFMVPNSQNKYFSQNNNLILRILCYPIMVIGDLHSSIFILFGRQHQVMSFSSSGLDIII